MRVWQVLIASLSALVALALVVAIGARRSQVERIEEASTLVVATQDLRSALGRADAASVNAFLAGGVDQPDQRQRYGEALDEAAVALQRAGSVAGTNNPDQADEAADAVAELQRLLPRYAGLIETARANNRQQLPLGAAYLRRASDVLRIEVSPQLDALRTAGEGSLRDIDEDVTGGLGLVPVAMMALLVAALVAAQRWLAGRTRRRINAGLALGTALMVIGSLWFAGRFGASGRAAGDGMVDGYDRLAALSALRTDAYDHQASATFALVDRGARDQFNANAASAAGRVDARLVRMSEEADRSGADAGAGAVGPLSDDWDAYREASDAATAQDLAGQAGPAREAITRSVNDPTSVAARFEAFDAFVLAQLDQADVGLDRGLGDARAALGWAELVSIALAVAVAGAAAFGLQRRLSEYR